MRVLVVMLFIIFSYGSGFCQTKNFIDQPYLEVIGYADTLITPDEVYLSIKISEKDTKDKMSVEELEKKMIDSLIALKIDVEKNLTSTDMLSGFKSYLIGNKDVIKSREYELKVGDAGTAAKVFNSLEKLGIANTEIERLHHSRMKFFEQLCMSNAVKDAQVQGKLMCQSLNQQIGKAIFMSKNTEESRRELSANAYGGRLLKAKSRYPTKYSKEEEPELEFRKIHVQGSMIVRFKLE